MTWGLVSMLAGDAALYGLGVLIAALADRRRA